MNNCEGPQSLALELPINYGLGVKCTAGLKLHVPVILRARNITTVTLRGTVTGESIIPLSEALNFSLDPDGEEIVVELEFLPLRASVEKEWVSLEVSGGRLYQAARFMIEVSESLGADARISGSPGSGG